MLAKKKLLGDYHVGKTIGQGAFSKVKIGFHKQTNQKVAIKVIDKKTMRENDEKSIKDEIAKARRKGIKYQPPVVAVVDPNVPSFVASLQLEVQLLLRLNHPNIIKLYSVRETVDECYVIMEYASGGELLDHLTSKGRLSENETRKYFRQLISAMDHCHKGNVVHRDLKLENLLLNAEQNLLISDFGLGRTFKSEDGELMKTFCGTPNYAAVELVSGIPYVGVKSDIWAMGVVLFILASGHPPFNGANLSVLYSKIKAVDYHCPQYFSRALKNLISKMLVKDPNNRCTLDDLRSDEWVNFEEAEQPPRILPKIVGDNDVSKISQFIAGITNEKNAIIYTLHKHQEDMLSGVASGISIKKRAKTIIGYTGNDNSINSSRDDDSKDSGEDGDIISLTPKVAHSAQKRRPSMDGSGFLRKIPQSNSPTTASPSAPIAAAAPIVTRTYRSRSASSGATIMRQPFAQPPPAASAAVAPTRGRRASVSVVPTKDNTPRPVMGEKIFRSPSSMVDDLDPFMVEGMSDVPSKTQDEVVPTSQEIVEWHGFHKPPKEVRTVRFSISQSTTSSLPPAEIFKELHRVILETQADHQEIVLKRVDDLYMVNMTIDTVILEVEVCKVWLLKVHGLRFKRLSGNPFTYKDIVESMTKKFFN